MEQGPLGNAQPASWDTGNRRWLSPCPLRGSLQAGALRGSVLLHRQGEGRAQGLGPGSPGTGGLCLPEAQGASPGSDHFVGRIPQPWRGERCGVRLETRRDLAGRGRLCRAPLPPRPSQLHSPRGARTSSLPQPCSLLWLPGALQPSPWEIPWSCPLAASQWGLISRGGSGLEGAASIVSVQPSVPEEEAGWLLPATLPPWAQGEVCVRQAGPATCRVAGSVPPVPLCLCV